MKISAAILTISDRSSKGEREDTSGPALKKLVLSQEWEVADCKIVPDDQEKIKEVLLEWCEKKEIPLILTTGGTGVGPRDITPEATRPFLEKELIGFSELMRQEGMKQTPLSILSRGIAGTRKKSLVINLPGSPDGACFSLEVLLKVIPHALKMIRGEEHESACKEHAHKGA